MSISVFENTPAGLSLREAVNRLFEDGAVRPERSPLAMPIDVTETSEAFVVHAVLPGVKKDEIKIHYEKDILSIEAEVVAEKQSEGTRLLYRERRFGSVSRTFRLPTPIDAEQANAQFQDGVLTLTLPKLESVKPRQIRIN